MDTELKTEDKKMKTREYMREYKKRKYDEDSSKIKELNKLHYYKRKYDGSIEDLHTYNALILPIVFKLKKTLNQMKQENPEILKEILQSYVV